MSTLIEELADWACSLDLEQVAEGTRQRVLLQHLNLAAASRE